MLELLLAGPGGGLLGLAGHFGKRWFAMKEAKQNHAFHIEKERIGQERDEKRFAHEQILHQQTIEANERDREHQFSMAIEQGSRAGLIEATRADVAAGEDSRLWPITVNVRAGMRPMLALLYVALMLIVAFVMRDDPAIMRAIVAAIIFCASTALTFYFGERPTRAIRDISIEPSAVRVEGGENA